MAEDPLLIAAADGVAARNLLNRALLGDTAENSYVSRKPMLRLTLSDTCRSSKYQSTTFMTG